MHTAEYLKEVVRPALAEGAQTAGRNFDDLKLYAPVFVITGEDQQQTDVLEQIVRRQIAFYGTTPSYAAVFEHHGYPDLGRTLSGLMRAGTMDAMGAAIPADLLEKIAIIDQPANIGRRLRERYDGVLDRVALYRSMGGDGEFGRWDELVQQIHA